MSRSTLFAGDALALAIITVIGFASHGEVGAAYLPRMLTTFLPLVAGWFLVAPWLGAFRTQAARDPRQLWRPPLAMALASPMAAVLRAAMLGTAALPLFTLILGASAALGMLVWRALWVVLSGRLPEKA